MNKQTTNVEPSSRLTDNYPFINDKKAELSFDGNMCIETKFGIKKGDLVNIKTSAVEGSFVYKGNGLFVSALEELENKRNKAVGDE